MEVEYRRQNLRNMETGPYTEVSPFPCANDFLPLREEMLLLESACVCVNNYIFI